MKRFSCELDAERRAQELWDDLREFIKHNPAAHEMNTSVVQSNITRIRDLQDCSLEYLNKNASKY